jgi:hypothetical protein
MTLHCFSVIRRYRHGKMAQCVMLLLNLSPILLITLFELILSVYSFFHFAGIRDIGMKLEFTDFEVMFISV